MMAIQKRDNLFTGVNPLLMSQLQANNDFKSFHNYYLIELTSYLNDVLPENYQASPEAKLTLHYRGYLSPQTRYPDILLSLGKTITKLKPTPTETIPDLLLPLDTDIIENDELVLIIRSTDGEQFPVMVIELLSPSNKLGSKELYIEKRKEFILSKMILVEIDLLHVSPSPIYRVPIYPHHDKSTPYYVALTNPNTEKLETALYQFGINQPMPKIRLPLLDGDSVLCDLDAVYQATFVKGRYGMNINYANTPLDMGAYSQNDQMKILSHLATIRGGE